MKNLKQLLSESDLIGKTINKIIDNDSLILMFENDEFAVIYSSDQSEMVYVDSSKMQLEYNGEYNHHILFEMGVMTKEQIDQIESDKKEKLAAYGREQDLKRIADLKAKYPEQFNTNNG